MSNNQEKLNEQLFNVIADEKASVEARLKKVKYLVRLGADVNTRLYGKSLLSKAIEKEAGAEVVEFLREKGANEWVIPKEEALELSKGFGAYSISVDEIKSLLKKGADVNAKDEDGRTLLMMVARCGKLDVVKYLIDNGADVNAKDTAEWPALRHAADSQYLSVVMYLVEQGADFEAKDRDAVLGMAKYYGRDDCLKFLEEYQKKVSAQKTKGDKTGGSQIVKANGGR